MLHDWCEHPKVALNIKKQIFSCAVDTGFPVSLFSSSKESVEDAKKRAWEEFGKKLQE
jgi:hypothetical protein